MPRSRCSERLDEFNEERKRGPPDSASASASTRGKAVAGEIGSINKKEYTVLGDTVNTASRLESSVAKPGTVVIGSNTLGLVEGLFECRSLGTFKVKGKALEVPAYEVLPPRPSRPLPRRRRRGGPDPDGGEVPAAAAAASSSRSWACCSEWASCRWSGPPTASSRTAAKTSS